ncbi:histidine phosphatase family protein [Thiomicrorhabdus sediminis]|uniref:Histidine phosphatase family protein n=1 Tax=Thiomicrorhabdus sediminis TaxID=2580412 RepID=A0A4P9K7X0_9GAMM|nr:histidine phosphatase family protein [Thiomicrorhabdus sediminis]QCU91058.1 histidine phosphatase family protein [Thiomicrorhabdus sediminis]
MKAWFIAALILFSPWSLSAQDTDNAELWQALQAGGKVVLMRHAHVDRSIGDSFIQDESCFTEKNLDELGKQQAQAINQAFAKHEIKVGQVFSSSYCRTKDTAELAFGTFQVNPILKLIRAIPVEQAKANMAEVRNLISDYQGGDNLIMVTHRPNIAEITNVRLDVAQMAVFEPLGDGLFDFLGVLAVPVEGN